VKLSALASPLPSIQRTMWPQTLLAARVGFVDRRAGAAGGGAAVGVVEAGAAAAVVVGQGEEDLTGLLRVGGDPLGRSIMVAPTRSAAWRHLISTSAWLMKPLAAVRPLLAVHQRDPDTGAHACRRRWRRRRSGRHTACRSPAGGGWRRWSGWRRRSCRGDEFVDVLVALVVAHVDHHLAVGGHASAAFSCLKRPSAVRLTGLEAGAKGSISTTQPKRCGSLGFTSASKRGSTVCQR
jgi:hypothetical protein